MMEPLKIRSDRKKAYIVILNWNGWRDTVECLESVFRNDYPLYQVIVCDNNSTDGSLEFIKAWADGRVSVEPGSKDERIIQCIMPPVKKPLGYAEYNRKEAELGGRSDALDVPLILIQTGQNLGYAGGNNVGLRYALSKGDFDFIWILNNDTVSRSDALSQLVKSAEKRPDAGIIGSLLIYYKCPDKIQAAGGWLDKKSGNTRHIEAMESSLKHLDEDKIISKMSYVVGASMLITSVFLRTVGLLNEEYFLYYEDVDWAVKASHKFNLGFASQSLVYHKEGASTNADRLNEMGLVAQYFAFRNKFIFIKKYFPKYLPLISLNVFIYLIWVICLGKFALAKAIIYAVIGAPPPKNKIRT